MRSTIVEIDGVPHRPCPGCERVLPLTAEHWCRAPKRKGGFEGWCKRCKRKRTEAEGARVRGRYLEWYAANGERERAKKAERRQTEPEKHKAQAKASYKRHREKRQAEHRAYERANRDRLNEARRAFYAANPRRDAEVRAAMALRTRAWREANRELTNDYAHRRRARVRDLTIIEPTPDLLAAKWDYWSGRCWMCGGEAVEWDHVKPLSKGGAHCLANLRPACRSCNATKQSTWPFQPAA